MPSLRVSSNIEYIYLIHSLPALVGLYEEPEKPTDAIE
jgi:hypothetical protein